MTIQTYQVPIAGQWRNAENDASFDTEDPFSGEVWAKVSSFSALRHCPAIGTW